MRQKQNKRRREGVDKKKQTLNETVMKRKYAAAND